MVKIAVIAKTNLNTDGRILNELKIIKDYFQDKIIIDFILMPDKPLHISIDSVSKIHIINTRIRNSKILRPFTVLDFAYQTIVKLKKIKPEIIHVQDVMVALPILLYKRYVDSSVVVIYDDHELPNENESIYLKINQRFENKLMSLSNSIITANEERLDYLSQNNPRFNTSKAIYFLNLPYFETVLLESSLTINKSIELNLIKKKNNFKYIMHQGIIEEERGRKKLAEFSRIMPENYKILILGVSKEYFEKFLNEFDLLKESFIFIGIVPYSDLSEYWSLADASIVMYLPTYINNRLCAPNRLYISFLNCIPIIVNKDNPVLSNFISKYNCGIYIEALSKDNLESELRRISYSNIEIDDLKRIETLKLIDLYDKLLNMS